MESNFLLDYSYQNKRILEVGCGIGLASLLLNHLSADITATDFHPAVEGFLDKNVLLNDDRKISFVLSDWREINTEQGTKKLIKKQFLEYTSKKFNYCKVPKGFQPIRLCFRSVL